MKISERTIKRLGEIITGDKALSPYRSGPKLVSFFNDFGTNHAYGQGFPSRWTFAEDCLRGFNDTTALRKIILTAVDPRDFMGATVFDKESQQNKPANISDAVTYLNEFLAYDGYEGGTITLNAELVPGSTSPAPVASAPSPQPAFVDATQSDPSVADAARQNKAAEAKQNPAPQP